MNDSLMYLKKLEAVGIPRAQAEAQVEIMTDVYDRNLATKQDLADLSAATKQDLADHRAATKQDLADLSTATKQDLADHRASTKQDYANFTEATKQEFVEIRYLIKNLVNIQESSAKELLEIRRDFVTRAELKADLADQHRKIVVQLGGIVFASTSLAVALLQYLLKSAA